MLIAKISLPRLLGPIAGFFVCSIVASLSCVGQTEPITVDFRFLTLSRIDTELYYPVDGTYERCRPRMNRFSESYTFRGAAVGDRTLVLYQASGTGEQRSFAPVASVTFPGAGNYILLLAQSYRATENGIEASAIRVQSIPDELKSARGSDWVFYNTTGSRIAAQIGEQRKPFTIAPRSQSHQPIEADGTMDFVQFAAEIEGEWQKFYSNGWSMFKGSRYLVLFLKKPEADRISVMRVASD